MAFWAITVAGTGKKREDKSNDTYTRWDLAPCSYRWPLGTHQRELVVVLSAVCVAATRRVWWSVGATIGICPHWCWLWGTCGASNAIIKQARWDVIKRQDQWSGMEGINYLVVLSVRWSWYIPGRQTNGTRWSSDLEDASQAHHAGWYNYTFKHKPACFTAKIRLCTSWAKCEQTR